MSKRYSLACDFDGVLHSYTSPWKAEHVIPDAPVPGAMRWLIDVSASFIVIIHSTRCNSWRGRRAVKRWIREHLRAPLVELLGFRDASEYDLVVNRILSAIVYEPKPAALMYIDDRGMRFEGKFPSAQEIIAAKPWTVTR
jgi:FMN phosphatase YigB (HAD superfamily)